MGHCGTVFEKYGIHLRGGCRFVNDLNQSVVIKKQITTINAVSNALAKLFCSTFILGAIYEQCIGIPDCQYQ